MSKETAVTPHGEVEYETVECDSCGVEIAKSEAYRFVAFSQGFDPSYVCECATRGWVCDYCREAPAGLPTDGGNDEVGSKEQHFIGGLISGLILALFLVVVLGP